MADVKTMLPLGRLVATCGVDSMILEDKEFSAFVKESIRRHQTGDWGDVYPEDKDVNEEALVIGERIFSVYIYKTEIKIWIITERDRSCTTVLFPEEY